MRMRIYFAGFLILLLTGCARQYFQQSALPAPIHSSLALSQWPYKEYWTGIVFNGQKIGFTHFAIEPAAGHFKIHSKAVLNFRFLGVSKELALQATDTVGPDLQLIRFEHEYIVDKSRRRISGERQGQSLQVLISHPQTSETRSFAISDKLYPSSVLALYPVMQGLAVDRRYAYAVFETETLQIAPVEQQVLGYETSPLFEGPAYRLETSLLGQKTQTWINDGALPVFEMSLHGVIISALETEQRAKRYLALAAINKQENLLSYSLVKSVPIAEPRQLEALELRLLGIPEGFVLISDEHQQCQRRGDGVSCRVTRAHYPPPGRTTTGLQGLAHYLGSSMSVPSGHPTITRQARAIIGDETGPRRQIEGLLQWMDTHIDKAAVDVFSALDVLEQKRAECQGHSYLYAALARSLGIPTRLVNGLVYSEIGPGFLYHTWTESWVDGRWIPIDPTFGQARADATHIKLVEGEDMAALSSLIPLIGRLEAHILSINDKPTQRTSP